MIFLLYRVFANDEFEGILDGAGAAVTRPFSVLGKNFT